MLDYLKLKFKSLGRSFSAGLENIAVHSAGSQNLPTRGYHMIFYSMMQWIKPSSPSNGKTQFDFETWASSMVKKVSTITVVPAYKGEYRIMIPWGMHAEVEEWLTVTFGPGSRNKKSTWRKHQLNGDYFIKGEKNVTLVQLRWSQ